VQKEVKRKMYRIWHRWLLMLVQCNLCYNEIPPPVKAHEHPCHAMCKKDVRVRKRGKRKDRCCLKATECSKL
jgi:hypothetical protein